MPAGIMPPARENVVISTRRAVAVPACYRALSVLNASVIQLSLDVTRNGRPVAATPSLARRPAQGMRIDQWLSQVVMDLATDGNAYLRKVTVDGQVIDLQILPAAETWPAKNERTGTITYHRGRAEYSATEIEHLTLLKLSTWLRGLSPIEAARRGITFADGAQSYTADWFNGGAQPNGILSSDQALTSEKARQYRDVWNDLDADGEPIPRTANPSGIKVLGAGLTYQPIMLKPADALWLEAMDFSTVDIARIYGTPSSLMLVGIDGGAQTYANVSQEWLAFTRFTLMSYLRPIELAVSGALGPAYDARFNVDALLRSDTLSRYQAHNLALSGGWKTANEVRADEGLAPLTSPAKELA